VSDSGDEIALGQPGREIFEVEFRKFELRRGRNARSRSNGITWEREIFKIKTRRENR
jgi:hypothetical protein